MLFGGAFGGSAGGAFPMNFLMPLGIGVAHNAGVAAGVHAGVSASSGTAPRARRMPDIPAMRAGSGIRAGRFGGSGGAGVGLGFGQHFGMNSTSTRSFLSQRDMRGRGQETERQRRDDDSEEGDDADSYETDGVEEVLMSGLFDGVAPIVSSNTSSSTSASVLSSASPSTVSTGTTSTSPSSTAHQQNQHQHQSRLSTREGSTSITPPRSQPNSGPRHMHHIFGGVIGGGDGAEDAQMTMTMEFEIGPDGSATTERISFVPDVDSTRSAAGEGGASSGTSLPLPLPFPFPLAPRSRDRPTLDGRPVMGPPRPPERQFEEDLMDMIFGGRSGSHNGSSGSGSGGNENDSSSSDGGGSLRF
jgi:hypothetical protein